jgi:Cu/Zn superoxide dismutase
MLNGTRFVVSSVLAGLATVVIGLAPAEALTVELKPQSNSGESGTATVTSENGKTKVVVSVKGQPAGTPQPMHIHKGTCAKLDPKPAYGLPSLVDGKAEATVDVALSALQKEPHAINGHKSAQEAQTYVFCGDIPAAR